MIKIKNIKLLLITLLALLSTPYISYAETHVYNDASKIDWVWKKENSPYILEESIYIPKGYSLTIDSGVSISSSVSDDINTISVDGNLRVRGSEIEPVIFNNLYAIYLTNSSTTISHANFNKTGLVITKSTTTIDHTVIDGAFEAININGSRMVVSDSTISNNSYGIISYLSDPPVFQSRLSDSGMGGIGNAVENIVIDPKQNQITIKNSRILNNKKISISNQTLNIIDAKDNWWGRETGPNIGETFGLVEVYPWLTADPNSANQICCSSIIFLPGFEASRLYKDMTNTSGTTTSKLWEPMSNNDVLKIYTNTDGTSVDKSVYTKDIIDKIPFSKNIYKTFIDSMNGMVSRGLISEWKSIPYDWRMGAYSVADDKMIEMVKGLAKTSKTGKVVIIAHSNGGLVTKSLMNRLNDLGFSNIVEKIILVAVPELGTPMAVSALLHGDGQALGFGYVLSEDNARNFARNLAGAYALLPYQKYFEKNPLTIISDQYSNNSKISSFADLKDFLLSNVFLKQSPKDTSIPILLNKYLLSLSESFHSKVDSWEPASSTKVVSIFGWGLPTEEGIIYSKDRHCNQVIEKVCDVIHEPVISKSGDGTVLTNSDSGNSDKVMYLNLKQSFKDTLKNVKHDNILESSHLLSMIERIVSNKETVDQNIDKYFTDKEPVDSEKYISIKLHSPVDIDVYDQNGKHVGLIYNEYYKKYIPDEDNTIPGSYYWSSGDEKMVVVPYSEDLKVSLNGNNAGVFSVDLEVSQSDTVIASTTFKELPSTPLMSVDLVLGKSIDTIASSPVMYIDVDGDGLTDVINTPDDNVVSTSTTSDIRSYLESIRKVILALKLPTIEEKIWLNRIDRLLKLDSKKNTKKVENIVRRIANRKIKNKNISDGQKSVILKIFNDLLLNIEKSKN